MEKAAHPVTLPWGKQWERRLSKPSTMAGRRLRGKLCAFAKSKSPTSKRGSDWAGVHSASQEGHCVRFERRGQPVVPTHGQSKQIELGLEVWIESWGQRTELCGQPPRNGKPRRMGACQACPGDALL